MSLTKEDLLLIRNELKGFATKDDLKVLATKDDLKSLETKLVERFDAKLDRVEGRILMAVGLLERDSFERIEDHDRRIARLERLNDLRQ